MSHHPYAHKYTSDLYLIFANSNSGNKKELTQHTDEKRQFSHCMLEYFLVVHRHLQRTWSVNLCFACLPRDLNAQKKLGSEQIAENRERKSSHCWVAPEINNGFHWGHVLFHASPCSTLTDYVMAQRSKLFTTSNKKTYLCKKLLKTFKLLGENSSKWVPTWAALIDLKKKKKIKKN